MSFADLSISIMAENLASAEFSTVASDAASMAGSVSGSFSLMGTEFANTGTQASNMGESVQQSAQNLAAMGDTAEATNIKLTTVARGFSTVAGFGSACTVLAGDLGIVDKQTAKWMSTILAVITVVSTFTRLQAYSTVLTEGHTASVALDTSAETASASSNIALAAAHEIKAAATWVATTAQNALNISQATFLALTGVGIGVIIAAAAAMAYFASQMNSATSSVQKYNAAASQVTNNTRSIQRSGDASLYRQGVEGLP